MNSYSSFTWSRSIEMVLAPIVLFVIYWIFLGRFLDGGHSRSMWVDNTYMIHPLFSFISKAYSAGEIPYWMDSIMGGVTIYNVPQFSILYPFYFLSWHLYRTPAEALLQVHYVTFLHLGILYLNTYVLLRILRLPFLPAVVGATLFAFCRNHNVYNMWVNIIAPYSWLPLALGSVFLILENRYPKSGIFLGTASVTLLTMASPAQPLIHFVYFTGLLLLSYWVIHRKQVWDRVGVLRNLLVLAGLSLILTAPVLIPACLSLKDMIRWLGKAGSVIGNHRLPYRAFLEGQVPVWELANVLIPFGKASSIVGNSYFGMIPMFLASFGIFKIRQHWSITPVALLGVWSLLSSTGEHLALAFVNSILPLWNKIREPDRHLELFVLCASILASFGLQYLWEWCCELTLPNARRHLLTVGLYALCLVGSYFASQRIPTKIPYSKAISFLVVFLLVLVSKRYIRWLKGGVTKTILGAVAIFPVLIFTFDVAPMKDGDLFSEGNLRSHRILAEIARLKDVHAYRLVVDDTNLTPRDWSMNGSYYGLRSFQVYLNPLPYTQWRQVSFAASRDHYAKLLGARYYLCQTCQSVPPDYVPIKELEGYSLYATEKARPRFFWSHEVAGSYRSEGEFYKEVESNDDYLKKVFLHEKDFASISSLCVSADFSLRAKITEEQSSLNSFHLSVETDTPGILVLNEYFTPDWKATVNQRAVKTFKVNLNQIGVLLPAGKTVAHFEFFPSLFVGLLWLYRIAAAVCFFTAVALAYTNRNEVKAWLRQELTF